MLGASISRYTVSHELLSNNYCRVTSPLADLKKEPKLTTHEVTWFCIRVYRQGANAGAPVALIQ